MPPLLCATTDGNHHATEIYPFYYLRCDRDMTWKSRSACLALSLSMGACGLDGAPSYSIAVAFFPAWLLCCAIGLFAALAFRVLLVMLKLDDVMPAKLLVYAAFGSGSAMWLWLSLFGAA